MGRTSFLLKSDEVHLFINDISIYVLFLYGKENFKNIVWPVSNLEYICRKGLA